MQQQDIDKRLAELPDNLRETVNIIHRLYQSGENIRYRDIRERRTAQGMTEGSDRTLAKAKKLWREIYNIESVSYDSPETLKQLIERSVSDIRDSIKNYYKEAADEQIADAEDKLTLAKQQLEVANEDNEKHLQNIQSLKATLDGQQSDTAILQKSFDDLTNTRKNLEKELAEEKVNYSGLMRDKQYVEQQLATTNKSLEDYKAMAEQQRQDQMVLLDNERTRANRLEREKQDAEQKTQHLQQQLTELQAKLASKNEVYQLLEKDGRNAQQKHQAAYKKLEADYQSALGDKHKLELTIARQESQIQSLENKVNQQPELNALMKTALKEMQQSMKQQDKHGK